LERGGGPSPVDQWEPMPQSYLAEIRNPDADLQWVLSAGVRDTSDPPEYYQMTLGLHSNGWNVLYGTAMCVSSRAEFSYIFPSSRPFIDLIGYIDENPEVFFNYSEFQSTPPCALTFPEGSEGGFQLVLLGYGVEGHYYTIAKELLPGGPPEIEYVISTIETEFLPELLQHPNEEYEFPNKPLFRFDEDN